MTRNVAAIALVPIATIFLLRSTVLAQPPTTTTTPSTTTGATATTTGGKSVWDGVYTEEQAKRGGPLYSEFCASCHGPELMGGEMAPPLATGDFLSGWDGLTVGDLFERIRISMPQNAPGSLSGQQNADILAYMFSANKFPAGTTEMPKEAGILKTIKFEVKKPVM